MDEQRGHDAHAQDAHLSPGTTGDVPAYTVITLRLGAPVAVEWPGNRDHGRVGRVEKIRVTVRFDDDDTLDAFDVRYVRGRE